MELAEASIAEGVTHIVCTPHASDRYQLQPEVNKERVNLLNVRLGGRLTLGLGCDVHLSFENIEDVLRNPSKYTINGLQYMLIEFPDFGISPFISERLFQFRANGLIPIITHPERNHELVANPNRMLEWLQCGCLIQLTAASLTGRFGKQAQAMSHELIKKNWVHFIASDAHNLGGRPPAMSPAYRLLMQRYGAETADRLCIQNPRAAFYGDALPVQSEYSGVNGDAQSRRSFFSRLFKR